MECTRNGIAGWEKGDNKKVRGCCAGMRTCVETIQPEASCNFNLNKAAQVSMDCPVSSSWLCEESIATAMQRRGGHVSDLGISEL